jgi:hypothetical protein
MSHNFGWKAISESDHNIGMIWKARKDQPVKIRSHIVTDFPPMVLLSAYAAQRSYMDQHLVSTAEENQIFAQVYSILGFQRIKSGLTKKRTGRLSGRDRLDLICSLYSINFLLSLPSMLVDMAEDLRNIREHLGRYVLHCLHELLSGAAAEEIMAFLTCVQILFTWGSWDLSETFCELSESERATEEDEDEYVSGPSRNIGLIETGIVELDKDNPEWVCTFSKWPKNLK